MKIEAKREQDDNWREITADALARYCVEITGGGYTVAQTVKGMELQQSILEGKPYTSNIGMQIRVTS